MQKNKKEKLLIAIIVILITIIVIGGSYATSEISYCKANGSNKVEDEFSIYNKIDIDEYVSLFRANSNSVIYIGRPTCTVCTLQNTILKEIIEEYGVKINYLNLDVMTKEDINILYNSYDKFANGLATPTVMIIGNKKVTEYKRGYTKKSELVTIFEKNKFIKVED